MSIRFFAQKNSTHKKCKEAGFTLFEIVFVMAIFAIMSSIVIFRFDNFGAQTTFDNLVQDVTLRVVNAQKTATSGTLNANLSNNTSIYGITFVSGPSTDTANHSFTYFVDYTGSSAVPDGLYNTGGTCSSAGSECLATTTISTGQYVSSICYMTTGTTPTFSCSGPADKQAHITFKRPFPDALMKICASKTTCASVTDASKVLIEFTDPSLPTKKTLIIKSLGQVRIFDGDVNTANSAS